MKLKEGMLEVYSTYEGTYNNILLYTLKSSKIKNIKSLKNETLQSHRLVCCSEAWNSNLQGLQSYYLAKKSLIELYMYIHMLNLWIFYDDF